MNQFKEFLKGLLGTADSASENVASSKKNETSNGEQVTVKTKTRIAKASTRNGNKTDGSMNKNGKKTDGLLNKKTNLKANDSEEIEVQASISKSNVPQHVSKLNEDLFDEMLSVMDETEKDSQQGFNIIQAIHEESMKHVEESLQENSATSNLNADVLQKDVDALDEQKDAGGLDEQNAVDGLDENKEVDGLGEPKDLQNKTQFLKESRFSEGQESEIIKENVNNNQTELNALVPTLPNDDSNASSASKLVFTPYVSDKVDSVNELSDKDIQKVKAPYLNENQLDYLVATSSIEGDPETDGEPPLKKKKVYIPAEIKEFSRSSFTKEEDELIKEYVRRNPHLKNTHKLYQRIGEVLTSHTGNSIRSRFFSTLWKDLEYVYEVNKKTGEILTDADGNYIKTTTLPGGIKKAYTAEEDYLIALAVKCVFYLAFNENADGQPDPLDFPLLQKLELDYYKAVVDGTEKYIGTDPEILCKNNDSELQIGELPSFAKFRCNKTKGPTTRKFFNQMSLKFPDHTPLSWRDRHDKFIKKYGVDKYIEYYNKCILLGVSPLPIKELSSVKSKALLELEKNPFAGTLEELEMRFKRKNNYSGNYNRENTKKP